MSAPTGLRRGGRAAGPIVAVARASLRAGANHAVRVVPRAFLVPVLLALLGVAVAIVVASHAAIAGVLGPADTPAGGLAPLVRERLYGTLALSLVLAVFAIALVFLGFLPQRSRIALAARLAGAGAWQVAMGETVPVLVALAGLSTTVTAGAFWYLAESRPVPGLSLLALLLLGGIGGVAALAVRSASEVLAARLRVPDPVAHALGFLVAFGALSCALVDTLRSSLAGGEPLLLAGLRLLWAGRALPHSLADVAVTAAALVLLLAAVVGVLRLSVAGSAFAAPWKILSLPRWGRPGGVAAVVARELLLAVRNPVSQLAAVVTLVLASLLVAAVRSGLMPAELAALGIALLVAAGAETAYGRSRPASWILHQAGVSPVRQVLAQQAALFGAQAVLTVVLVVAAVPLEAVPITLLAIGPAFVAMFAVAYVGGVAVPYTDAAPTGMTLTSALVVAGEVLVLWASSSAASVSAAFGALVGLLIAGVAVAGSAALARLRGPV